MQNCTAHFCWANAFAAQSKRATAWARWSGPRNVRFEVVGLEVAARGRIEATRAARVVEFAEIRIGADNARIGVYHD